MHLTDEMLLALVHREQTGSAETDRHLAACATCLIRLASFRREEAELATFLSSLDLPVPTTSVATIRRRANHRPRMTWLVAAAALLATLTAVATAMPNSPLRRWLTQAVTRNTTPIHPAAGEVAGSDANGIQVSVGDEFTLHVTHAQSTGVLEVSFGDQPTVSAQSHGGTVGYTVRPAALILDNLAPAARIEVTLPRHLTRARIFVAGQRVFDLAPGDGIPRSGTLTLSLSPSPSTEVH